MSAEYRIKKIRLESAVFNRKKHIPSGQIKRLIVTSVYLANTRALDIYLPPGYRRTKHKRYPVLYMHDGNNLFFPEIAFGHWPWGIDKTLNRLFAHGLMDEIIVVGIHNTPGRHYEYAWNPMRFHQGSEGGGGERYGRFLVEEVKPLIDRQFRTLPAAEHTGIMGASMGGLISFYLGMHWPHIFSKIGLVSPSFWWNWGEPIHDAQHLSRDLQIWLDMGTREGNPHQKVADNLNIRNTRLMKRRLEAIGYREGKNLAYLEDRGAYHTEYFWGRRFHLPMLFFWGRKPSLIWKKKV